MWLVPDYRKQMASTALTERLFLKWKLSKRRTKGDLFSKFRQFFYHMVVTSNVENGIVEADHNMLLSTKLTSWAPLQFLN